MPKGINILITGCTSTIGRSIIKEFAPNNSLFLISRKSAKDNVLKLKENALLLGSNNVTLIEYDLGDSPNSHLNEIVKNNYDLFINLASSTSKINDEDIFPLNHQYHTNIDLANPLIIVNNILEKQMSDNNTNRLTMILISSILTKISHQDQYIYTSYKILQGEYIKRIKNKYNDHFNYLFVYVGSRIDRNKESKKTKKIARALKYALNRGKNNITIGYEGKVLLTAHLIHPLLCRLLINIGRLLKNTN